MNAKQIADDVEFLASIDGFDAESIDEVINACEKTWWYLSRVFL